MEKLALTIGNYTINPPSSIPSGAVSPVGEKILTALINLMLALALVLGLIFLVLGGIRWITSAGDPKGIEAARRQIIYAIIGLIVAGFAYAIVITVGNFFGAQLLPDASFIPRPFPYSSPSGYGTPSYGTPSVASCNNNGSCQFGEDINTCPGDCPFGGPTTCSNMGNLNAECWYDQDCQALGGTTCNQNTCTCPGLPQQCNNNGSCQFGEDINTCPGDCPYGLPTRCSDIGDINAVCWYDQDCQAIGLTTCNQPSCICF